MWGMFQQRAHSHFFHCVCVELMMEMEPPKSMRKSPLELLNKDQMEQNKRLVSDKAMKTTNLPNDSNDERNQTDDDEQTFHPTFRTSPFRISMIVITVDCLFF